MKCPKCQSDNPDDSKFCKECGSNITAEGETRPSFTKTLKTPSKGLIPGTTFAARYKVIEELGRGGQGVVYKSEDAKLKRKVAIKLLPPELTGDKEAKERFIREAQSAAVLDHPNICTIYEVDESDEQTFISMAYVDGQNLRERVKDGPLEIKEGLDLGIQAIEGLAAAHNKGLIHRDIKSANIMVTKQGQAKIMDFGLAKLTGASTITREGVTMGTVAYMSPEQAQGKTVDHRSDIWSLGVVLYELFGGQLPFQGETEASFLYSIVHEDQARLKDVNPDIPIEIQKVINRALKKKPDQRYQSAEEMAAELSRYCDLLKTEEAGVISLRTLLQRMKQPRIIVPMILLLALVASAAIWSFNRRSKIRGAQEAAIPEITRLLGQDSYVEAFSLAKEVETYLKDDENLKELMAQMVQYISIGTSPNGADIFLKPFSEDDVEEEYLGQSPLEKVRFPFGPFWLRIEKEGYETYQSFYYGPSTYAFPDAIRRFEFTLDEKDSIPTDMVRIPETMAILNLYGFSRENLQLFPYYIDKYEVSNREFKRFIDNGGYQNPEYWAHEFIKDGHVITFNEALAEFRDQTDRAGPSTWEAGTYPEGQDDFPVSGVSWYEAAAFAKFAGKTLPSIYHWVGATDTDMSTFIIPFSNFSNSGPRHVGSGPVGPQGTYDMAGNVKEWCWNASGNLRFILGGGWNEPSYMYSESDAQSPFTRLETYGFRCAQYMESNEEFLEECTHSIQLPAQKIHSETPVSDEAFHAYISQYSYDPIDLEAVVESADESVSSWIRERIIFNAAYDAERVIAYLFIPRNVSPPYQTVVYFPGASARRQRSIQDMQLRIIDFIIRSGRAVMYPIYKGTHERSGIKGLGDTNSRAYIDFQICLMNDLQRSIDYLETREDIDMTKLAYYGFSWGGAVGPIALALEKRFSLGIFLDGGLYSFQLPPEVNPLNFAPHVDVPVLMVNGSKDFAFPLETSQIPLFDLLGTQEEHKVHRIFDHGHATIAYWRNQVIREILNWLDRYFGQPSSY